MSGNDEKWAFEIPGKLEIPFRYFAGRFNSKFLTTLRDEKKIMACRCPTCGKVFMPPRSSCEVCFTKIEDWIQVGPAGEVTSWTVVRYSEPHLPVKPPYILALIKLDGADTALAHIIMGIKPEDMKTGIRVSAVFAKERKASITAIAYFKPVGPPEKKPAPKKPAKKKVIARKASARKKVAEKKASRPKKKVVKKAVKKTAGKKVAKKRVARKKEALKKSAKKKAAKKKVAKSGLARKVVKKKAVKKTAKKKAAGKPSRGKPVKRSARKTSKKGKKRR